MTQELEKRIEALELWKSQIDISRAREEVDRVHMDKRFDAIEKKLTDIGSTARQLTFAVASAVLVYIATFVMNGGLAIVQK